MKPFSFGIVPNGELVCLPGDLADLGGGNPKPDVDFEKEGPNEEAGCFPWDDSSAVLAKGEAVCPPDEMPKLFGGEAKLFGLPNDLAGLVFFEGGPPPKPGTSVEDEKELCFGELTE